jgi:dTDP-4-dehydrorhamnose reductase
MKTLLTGASGFVGAFMQRRVPCIPMSDSGHEVDLRDIDGVRRFVDETSRMQ